MGKKYQWFRQRKNFMKRSRERTKKVCSMFNWNKADIAVFASIPTLDLFLSLFFNVCTAEQKTESPDEPSEVKSQQKPQRMRKNKMKAKLIIRNLSFKVSDYDEIECCEVWLWVYLHFWHRITQLKYNWIWYGYYIIFSTVKTVQFYHRDKC